MKYLNGTFSPAVILIIKLSLIISLSIDVILTVVAQDVLFPVATRFKSSWIDYGFTRSVSPVLPVISKVIV